MPKKKVEVYNKDELIYPFIESDHVSFSNGMKVSEMLNQSISMPTVTHEDLSFKVGVGDQDVSSAIVDSSVAKMTIKGKTYQNILPAPSTHVLTNNKEMFKVNEGLDPNVEIVDGVSKSAILKGQTLVNLLERFHHGCSYDSETGIYTSTQNEWVEPVRTTQNVKVNVPYTLFAKVNTTSDYIYIRLDYNDGVVAKDSIINGHVTPNSDIFIKITVMFSKENRIRFVLRNTHDGVVKMSNIMLIEGDHTNQDIPYFEGMASCKMPVLTTMGKNLFDGVNQGYYLNIETRLAGITSNDSGAVVDVSSINKATVSSTTIQSRFRIACTNTLPKQGEGTVRVYNGINLDGNSSTKATIDCSNYKYLIVNATDLSIIQVEQGSTATPYEPYKSNILSCELVPMNQSMFEQGTFAESTPPNTKTYQQIKLDSNNLYDTRIRTKGTYKVAQGATYEVQLNDGYGIFICFCKNGLYSATVNRWLGGTSTFTVPNDCDEMFFAIRKTDNSAITTSDYSRIGLKIHQEVVLRSLPNGMCDTLNLNTGEYVQRIGEKMLNGASNEGWFGNYKGTSYQFVLPIEDATSVLKDNKVATLNSDTIPSVPNHTILTEELNVEKWGIAQRNNGNKGVFIAIPASAIETYTVESFKQWLAQNPITIQYELATPVVKTVDLSSSGNWEKVVLDGKSSENWQQNSHSGNFIQFEGYSNFCLYSLNLPLANRGLLCDKLSYYGYDSGFRHKEIEGISDGGGYRLIFVRVKTEKLPTNDVAGFRQWLSQNPIEVSYMLSSNKDSTQVKQPIFFKDGHIQFSSGVDHSLIPTLDYQAKTSNSYVMDLMKTNTKYTMKAKSANGTFTIDGTSYGAGTNGTFTTPTSMTNKFLVMSNKTNTEVMILEGDVTSKTIPYFKGIKSAFEGEDKIEVLSCGKNLFNTQKLVHYGAYSRITVQEDKLIFNDADDTTGRCSSGFEVYLKKGSMYILSLHNKVESVQGLIPNDYVINATDGSTNGLMQPKYGKVFTCNLETGVYRIRLYTLAEKMGTASCQVMLEEVYSSNATPTAYEPYKSNSTKIPLLSPLRSLPNGVCDEIILDRENNKAKIVQRVGKTMITTPQVSKWYMDNNGFTNVSRIRLEIDSLGARKSQKQMINNLVPVTGRGFRFDEETTYIDDAQNYWLWLHVSNSRLPAPTIEGFKSWLSQNPLVTYYELETPIITEVDLEGFPYVYKDGHIFLNSEIVPTTEIIYSINQCQQISASNEDIIRHEKELTYLQKLIAQYVQVDYESALLSLKV